MIRLVLAGLLTCLAVPALAAGPICGTREALLTAAEHGFGEVLAASGDIGNKRSVELLLSDNGSWSILIPGPDGRYCIVMTGTNWQQHRVPGRDS